MRRFLPGALHFSQQEFSRYREQTVVVRLCCQSITPGGRHRTRLARQTDMTKFCCKYNLGEILTLVGSRWNLHGIQYGMTIESWLHAGANVLMYCLRKSIALMTTYPIYEALVVALGRVVRTMVGLDVSDNVDWHWLIDASLTSAECTVSRLDALRHILPFKSPSNDPFLLSRDENGSTIETVVWKERRCAIEYLTKCTTDHDCGNLTAEMFGHSRDNTDYVLTWYCHLPSVHGRIGANTEAFKLLAGNPGTGRLNSHAKQLIEMLPIDHTVLVGANLDMYNSLVKAGTVLYSPSVN
jgi:hypothetical protein